MANSGGGTGGGAKGVRAGAAFVELFADDNKLTRSLNRWARDIKGAGAKLSGIGAAAVAGGGGLFGGAVAALKGVTDDVAGIGKAADAFKLTSEAASELFGVLKASGSDLRDATEGLITLNKNVQDAISGTGKEAKELFDELGVSAREFDGLNPADKFYKMIDAIRQASAAGKDGPGLLGKAFGEDTGKNLLNTLSMTTAEMRAQGKQFTITAAEMKTARRAAAAFGQVSAVLSNAWNRVVIAVAETVPFERVAVAIGNAVRQVRDFAAANADTIRTVLLVAGGAAAGGAAFLALGNTLFLIGTAFAGVAIAAKATLVAMGTLLSPVGAVTAAVLAGGYAWFRYTESGQAALGSFLAVVREFAGTFGQAWGGISDALSAGNVGLAADIAATAVEIAYAKLTGALTVGFHEAVGGLRQAWAGFAGYFADAWNGAVSAVAVRLVNFRQNVLSALIDLGAAFKGFGATVIGVFGSGLGRVLGKMVSDALKVMERGSRLVGASGAADALAAMRQQWDAVRWQPGDARAAVEAERKGAQEELKRQSDQLRAQLAKERADLSTAAGKVAPGDTAAEQAAKDAAAKVADLEARLAKLTAEAAAGKAAKPSPAAEVAAAARNAINLAGATQGGGVGGGFGSIGQRFGAGESGLKAITTNTANTAKNVDELKKSVTDLLGGLVYR